MMWCNSVRAFFTTLYLTMMLCNNVKKLIHIYNTMWYRFNVLISIKYYICNWRNQRGKRLEICMIQAAFWTGNRIMNGLRSKTYLFEDTASWMSISSKKGRKRGNSKFFINYLFTPHIWYLISFSNYW